jgi:predicted anti-sigma-YlaC factor YlaD
MDKECENFGPLLSAYLDAELSYEERDELEKHLETCETCSQFLRELRETEEITKKALSPEFEPPVDLSGVWEEIEARIDFGPSIWKRMKKSVVKPVVWLPGAVATGAVVLLIILFPLRSEHPPMELSRVESVYSATGQVMVLQTPGFGRPLIWILPGSIKEGGL